MFLYNPQEIASGGTLVLRPELVLMPAADVKIGATAVHGMTVADAFSKGVKLKTAAFSTALPVAATEILNITGSGKLLHFVSPRMTKETGAGSGDVINARITIDGVAHTATPPAEYLQLTPGATIDYCWAMKVYNGLASRTDFSRPDDFGLSTGLEFLASLKIEVWGTMFASVIPVPVWTYATVMESEYLAE